MNEVKHIHIGRQQFTVSVEAYHELKSYLDAITKQAGATGADVAEEVELRMAELLSERGITPKKVILPKDIAFLKSQLGEPSDFSDEEAAGKSADTADAGTTKRLFRDIDHAMVAGVAAGLARYLDIDAVIVRIIFVALAFFGGSGILIYILLWLLVPEAKTASERLSMQGKAATIDNLKQVVERADVPGAARRGTDQVARLLKVVGTVLLFIIGIPLVVGAGVALLGVVTATAYVLLNGLRLGGQVLAPVGGHEVVGVIAAAVAVCVILLFMLLVGVAMIRRRWQLPAWGVATLVGIFFLAATIGGALAGDVAPNIQHKVQALHHSKTVQESPFTSAVVTGDNLRVEYIPDSRSYVQYQYYGNLPLAQLHTAVTDNKLVINTGTAADGDCDGFCNDIQLDLEVDIHTPNLTSLTLNGRKFDAQDSGAPTPESVFFHSRPYFLRQGTVEYFQKD